MFKYTKSSFHYISRDIKRIYKIILIVLGVLTILYDGYAIYRDFKNTLYFILDIAALAVFLPTFILRLSFHTKLDDTRIEKFHKERRKKIAKRVLKTIMYTISLFTITLAIIEIVATRMNGLPLVITLISIALLALKIIIDISYSIITRYLDLIQTGFEKDVSPILSLDKVNFFNRKAETIIDDYSYIDEENKKLMILENEIELMNKEKTEKRLANKEIVKKNKEIIKAKKKEAKEARKLAKNNRDN